MSRVIFLDSGPLSLLTQRAGVVAADACRHWLAGHLASGDRFVVPEIVDYELRRELLRTRRTSSIARLDAFNAATPDRYLALTTAAIRAAAQLWADSRQRGLPTTDPKELDVDVILAAQILTTGSPRSAAVVATTNPTHLSRFIAADLWQSIR